MDLKVKKIKKSRVRSWQQLQTRRYLSQVTMSGPLHVISSNSMVGNVRVYGNYNYFFIITP